MNRTIDINLVEQAGTLTWWAGFSKTEYRQMTGNFMLALDGHTVIARKIGGRNYSRLCDIADVESFVAKTANS